MKLLLDTHIVLWWLGQPDAIRGDARVEIANPRNAVFYSAASMFEIAAKESAGKLKLTEDFRERLTACRFTDLSVSVSHADAVRRLPLHHRDPFDRLLIAQAQVEGLTLVTRDAEIGRYEIPVLAA